MQGGRGGRCIRFAIIKLGNKQEEQQGRTPPAVVGAVAQN